MKIIGSDKLVTFGRRHSNASAAFHVWLDKVRRADWKAPYDVKAQFRSADFLSENRVIFNIKGNHYRLVTEVNYSYGWMAIEWVGTHAEYDKQRFR